MTRFFVRYEAGSGRFIAMISRENHYPIPEPRNDAEAILEISSDMYLLVNQRPEAWNYAGNEITPLAWGRLSVSTTTFYPKVVGLREDLDDCVEMQAQFPDLPKDDPIKVSVNGVEHDFPNYGDDMVRLTATGVGLYSVRVVDKRVLAETPSFLLNCIEPPVTA